MKETDDWWRFKSRVEKINVSRKKKVFKSHIFVFDESMSAFIPRYVFIIIVNLNNVLN